MSALRATFARRTDWRWLGAQPPAAFLGGAVMLGFLVGLSPRREQLRTGGETMEMTERIEETARELGARVRPQIEEAKQRLVVAERFGDGLHQGEPRGSAWSAPRGRLPDRQARQQARVRETSWRSRKPHATGARRPTTARRRWESGGQGQTARRSRDGRETRSTDLGDALDIKGRVRSPSVRNGRGGGRHRLRAGRRIVHAADGAHRADWACASACDWRCCPCSDRSCAAGRGHRSHETATSSRHDGQGKATTTE